MYTTQSNGADAATINPAALSSADLLSQASRGIKRSRSPESYQAAGPPGSAGDDGDKQARKRGRPMKTGAIGNVAGSPSQAPLPAPGRAAPPSLPPQPPQNQNAPMPQQPAAYAAPQTSPPPKPAPAKSTLKALPTVRDHTTDQLGPGGDEYIPREIDDAGEKKVMQNGQLTGGRTYKCRTFLVPHRGDKLFMLATECARVLGYRDSYLLFNKNRSLFKIIASQVEKDDLVSQEILPFSYRSRQIAIVTARSMFRQFGSRVIVDGRRVRDDYWETKARKQGFTEADLAGEKRPGASKAREAEASQHAAMLGAPHGEIVYSTASAQYPPGPQPQLVSPDYNDARNRDYSNILKTAPRQEITGPAYQDRTTTAPLPELHAHSHQAAEFNRSVNQQREMRGEYLQSMWRRPHDQPAQPSLAQPAGAADAGAIPTSRAAQSPHNPSAGLQQQQSSGLVPNQSPSLMMTAAPYAQSLHAQQQPVGQTPLRGPSSTLSQPQSTYSYPPPNQMWPPPGQAPQQQAYSYTTQPSAQHAQQSPAPQMRHPSAGSGVQPGGLPYSGMPGINQGYASASQGMYSADQTPRQYMHQSPAPPPAVTQAWSQHQQAPAQWWSQPPQ